MATQGSKNQIRGAIGPVIYQQQNGKTIIRSKPASIRQTKATKSSSNEFQYCSRWSKFLRAGLKPLWLGNTDSLVSQRLTAALYAALQRNTTFPKGERNWSNTDMSSLAGFETNMHSPFDSYCRVEIEAGMTASRTLSITLPQLVTAQSIRYPDRCNDAELVCCITATAISTGELMKMVSENFPLPKSTAILDPQTFETEPLPEDCILVAAVQLVFYRSNSVSGRYSLNTKKINPGVLLWVGVL
jgi:hypothetical protein